MGNWIEFAKDEPADRVYTGAQWVSGEPAKAIHPHYVVMFLAPHLHHIENRAWQPVAQSIGGSRRKAWECQQAMQAKVADGTVAAVATVVVVAVGGAGDQWSYAATVVGLMLHPILCPADTETPYLTGLEDLMVPAVTAVRHELGIPDQPTAADWDEYDRAGETLDPSRN